MTNHRLEGELPGALVVSVDFELHWGVRDHSPAREAEEDLLRAREAIPSLLELFEEFEIAATWATVGFLFARDRAEQNRFRPPVLPSYTDPSLSPYGETVGTDEADDPLHFAPSLIERIRHTPRQEIGTHTFSHYYCHEPGQTEASFRADIESAVAIARGRDIRLRSIVFPRNQINESYAAVLLENGITAYRGNPPAWMWRFGNAAEGRKVWKRVGRLGDAFLPVGHEGLTRWASVLRSSGMSDVAATQLIRPQLPLGPLRALHVQRVLSLLRAAARSRKLVHLWWHPHNFGRFQARSMDMLRSILREYADCRRKHGMISLHMAGVDKVVRSRFTARTTEGACVE